MYEWLQLSLKSYYKLGKLGSIETHYFDTLINKEVDEHSLQPIKFNSFSLKNSWSNYLLKSNSFTLNEILYTRFLYEKTPAYFDMINPIKIQQLLPSIKLLLSLRNPIERLWSSYWRRCFSFKLNLNTTTICSLQHFIITIIEPIELCLLKQSVMNNSCLLYFQSGYDLRSILLGMYSVYIEKYLKVFNNENKQLLIIFSESFIEKPLMIIHEILNFCNLNNNVLLLYKKELKYNKKFNLYTLKNKFSKGLQKKPKSYLSFHEIPISVINRMNLLYFNSNLKLKELLFDNNKTLFFQLSKVLPKWILNI